MTHKKILITEKIDRRNVRDQINHLSFNVGTTQILCVSITILLGFPIFYPATSQRSLVWLRGDIKSPKSSESREERKLPGNLLVHDDARVLQPRRTVTDGKARYKNWVRAFVPQECGLHTFPLFTLYSRLSSLANLLPLTLHPLYPFIIHPPPLYVFAHMFRFRKSDFIQNLCVTKSIKHFINLFAFFHIKKKTKLYSN